MVGRVTATYLQEARIEDRDPGESNFPLTDKGALGDLRRKIRDDFGRVGADPFLVFECLVSVTEACTNALKHGQSDAEAGEHEPNVTWIIEPESARFTVRDFSARRWSDRWEPIDLTEPATGGYGIELMRKLMDEVSIETDPEGTTVKLTKLLST
ncbi:MAG: ATP-binding protein [Actinomycetota bacterium]|nr:ATP-binding protein [Actinomycetota bacterium]